MNNLKSEKTDLFFRDLCFLSQMIYDNDFIVTRNEQETKAWRWGQLLINAHDQQRSGTELYRVGQLTKIRKNI